MMKGTARAVGGVTETAERLTTLRGLGGRRSGTQVVYVLYVALLVTALLGAPVVRGVVLTLAEPPLAALLRAPGSPLVVAASCGVLLAAALAGGTVRGPVLLTPVRALLASTDLPRRRTLRGALLAPVVVLVAAAVAVASLLGGALVLSGAATPASGVVFVVASAAFAAVSGVVWLAGQVLAGDHPGLAALAAGALVAATALTSAVPGLGVLAPWGWLSLTWPGVPGPGRWPLATLCVAACAALAGAPALLDHLHAAVLLDQSGRWQAARTAASTGDLATALTTFRTGPRRGRARRAVVAAPAPVRYLVRDLVGASRTPGRTAVATAALVTSGLLTALATTVGTPASWALATLGATVGFAALGVFSDGFRHVAAAAGSTRTYGYGTAARYALHAMLPLVWGAVCAGAGAAVAVVTGTTAGTTTPLVLTTAVAVGVVLVAVRAYDSARGPLPLALLAPIPTPDGGNLSGLFVALWQVDAVLVAALASAVVVAAMAADPLSGARAATVVVAVAVAMTVRRLRRA